VCSFFIFRNVQPRTTVVLTSSTSPIVPGDASSAGGPSAMQMRVRAPSSSSNAALGPSKPQAAELPNLAPPPPPMVSAAAASVATTPLQEALPPPPPCTSLSCTRKLRNLEPPWVNLSFQPRIDWKAGGIRGDCVVGEIEYISIFYCDPPSKPASGHLPTAHSNWPSEERLELADIHSQALPKASLAELTRLLPNQTLLIMGDSVMEQFYNALQCMLRKEELEAPNDPKFLNFIKTNEYLWKMGKRKMPPKLPQQARTGTRLLFSRQVNYQAEDVAASLATGNVIVVNWGLHYHDMQLYARELHAAFAQFEAHASRTGNAVLFRETGAQHFKEADERGAGMLRSSTGEWEKRDKSTDKHCACSPIEDFNVNRQNHVLHEVLASGKYPHVHLLPFYELTRPRWRWHFGNCTHRPNGWNYETCCDCSHFCYTPGMWKAHLHDIKCKLHVAP